MNTLESLQETSKEKKIILVKESWSYLYIKDKETMRLEEGTISGINENDYIILLEHDERKNFFEFIIDTYDLEEGIDLELINSWKTTLENFLSTSTTEPEKLYQKYKLECKNEGCKPKLLTTFRRWLKGEVFGTRDSEDLLILGKIIEDKELQEEYSRIHDEVRILWKMRRSVGAKLNAIIKEALKGVFNQETVSLEDSILY